MAVRQHKYADNCEYFGEWNSEGQRHGYGHLKYSDGVDYKGELNKGWQQGYGIMTIPAKYAILQTVLHFSMKINGRCE
jgi:hypothetical protein